ncbi:LAMI_0A03598g1_1 [Lachancea mirantina]|uniref:Cation-transporting ATPase n=1 Tax=Lachancea mirantina TaxID=1230905 RepID=A0A1G4INW1_9SACH|nr:LAMI_0A03598g1_1 [Lachancea mirantina]
MPQNPSRPMEVSPGSHMRGRPSFSSARTASSSNTLTSTTVLESNNAESYSGATFETVPSSIVSFHHPHSFHSNLSTNALSSSMASHERRDRRPVEEESLVTRRTSRSRSGSRTPHFRFFSEEEIELAEGVASTMEIADYDIDWDATPSYEQRRLQYQHRSSRSSLRSGTGRSLVSNRSKSSTHRSESLGSYGSNGRSRGAGGLSQTDRIVSSSPQSSLASSRYSFRDRIPAEIENGDGPLSIRSSRSSHSETNETGLLDNEDRDSEHDQGSEHRKKTAYRAEYLSPQYHDMFFPQFVPHLHFQRFYIAEEDLLVGIAGYRTSYLRLYLYYALSVFTCGLFYLSLRWIPRYKVQFIGVKTALAKAEWVAVENEFGELSLIKVNRQWYNRPLSTLILPEPGDVGDVLPPRRHHNHRESDKNPNVPIMISFSYRYINLIYTPLGDLFRTNSSWTDADWLETSSLSKGLSSSIVEDRLLAFGKNSVNLKQKSVAQILFDEALHPFYVFQIFSIILWLADDYYYYAACILIISVFSVTETLIETRKTSQRLSEISHTNHEVRVLRDGFWAQINSSELVPGDVFEVSDPSLESFPCDSLLLNGDCIVNESMLTGESVPVSKIAASTDTVLALLEDFQNSQISNQVAKSFLFNGTKLIRARITKGQNVALAMAVRTGFSTTKGSLIRSMVFPKPTGFKFYSDSFKYIGFMALIAIIGFMISCVNFVRLGLDYKVMILRALDIITIVVPPALPATLSYGTSFALTRLKTKGIFCIAPTRVNVGGKIDVMCFDKTGTLTEDGLDVLGVHVAQPRGLQKLGFSELITDVHDLFNKFSLKDCSSPHDFKARNFMTSLLTCHSLRAIDGELIGDPLDYKMFQFTGWAFDEDFQNSKFHSLNEERYDHNNLPENAGISPAVVHPNASNPNNKFTENDPQNLLGIVRSFEFLAHLRRMSVIVKPFGENVFWGFTKGAPEVISEICNKNTMPRNYEELLEEYTHNGFRVIACAGKTLPKHTWRYAQKISREELESNLEFLGFIVFENKLKGSTSETLKTLNDAKIRTIMCTGDNVLTAISVGKESGLIKEPEVYVPSINESMDPAENLIVWQEIHDPEKAFDDITLKPANSNADYTLAMTGEVFRLVFKNNEVLPESYVNEVLLRTSIYARMSPDEKHELVEQLQKLDYIVGFCGDGANDCGALKAADVGISLSEAEASVAAPFTSGIFEISCVLDVIKEGRAALTTSFSCFQYMSLYSAIQFISITMLYSRGTNLGDFQFLYIDLLLIVPIAISMSWSKPYDRIVAKRPSANLVSPKILVPMVVNILIIFLFQFTPWIIVQRMPWYVKPIVGGDDAVQSSDNTILFFVSNFQYVMTAVVLSVGPPYREPASKNPAFLLDIACSTLLSIVLMLQKPDGYLGRLFELTGMPMSWLIFILLWAIVNLYVLLYLPKQAKQTFKKRQSSKKYKRILSAATRGFDA